MKRATNTLFVVLMVFLTLVFSACSHEDPLLEDASVYALQAEFDREDVDFDSLCALLNKQFENSDMEYFTDIGEGTDIFDRSYEKRRLYFKKTKVKEQDRLSWLYVSMYPSAEDAKQSYTDRSFTIDFVDEAYLIRFGNLLIESMGPELRAVLTELGISVEPTKTKVFRNELHTILKVEGGPTLEQIISAAPQFGYRVIESASERTVYLMNDKRWFFLTIQDRAADVCDSPLEGVSSRFQLFEPQDESVRTIEYAFGSVLFFSDEYSVLSVGTIWLEFLEQIEMT